uniref:tRNA(Phe) (4-demethylwyosine(37)-C(7)) aminocarboxypropyltransferase n=1 Tax=Bionectria ochroleuca TaxID=29856 RepID=A0A8H7NDZ7_BIOOC
MGKQRQQNPILSALSQWLEDLGLNTPGAETDDGGWRQEIIDKTPKRFTVYEPMALLPAGSFTHPSWKALLARVGETAAAARLWPLILRDPALLKEGDEQGEENVLRSPSGLRMLHGDFGPSAPVGPGGGPAEEDFERALWVSTKQNGIYQTWAPRWTMFSRGNAGHDVWAADLYGGIGYFVFSYASLGMRVLCWEINPWSVEGLRRGALANRWTIRVVQGDELQLPAEDLIRGGEQIVVFLEDNQKALGRIRSLQASGSAGRSGTSTVGSYLRAKQLGSPPGT